MWLSGKEKKYVWFRLPDLPYILPLILNFILQILKLEENSRINLFCSAILFQLENYREKKNTYQNDYPKQIYISISMHSESLVLEVKGLKQDYI